MISQLKEIREYLVEELSKVPMFEDIEITIKEEVIYLLLAEQWTENTLQYLNPILDAKALSFYETDSKWLIAIYSNKH